MLLLKKQHIQEKKHYYYFWNITKIIYKFKPIKLSNIILTESTKQINCFNKKNIKIYTQSTNPINKILWNFSLTMSYLQKKNEIMALKLPWTHYFMFLQKGIKPLVLIKVQLLSTIFSNIIDMQKNKIVYSAGYGNYVILMKYNKLLKTLTFTLPSKKRLVTSDWSFGVCGRNNFQQVKNFISPYKKTKIQKQKLIVRGVAKNSFDHHNGGSSNRKPLFLNKYNKIAKYGK